jgi:hypothetical protein
MHGFVILLAVLNLSCITSAFPTIPSDRYEVNLARYKNLLNLTPQGTHTGLPSAPTPTINMYSPGSELVNLDSAPDNTPIPDHQEPKQGYDVLEV